MNLRFKCDCGFLIVVPPSQAGKRAPCPSCGKLVRAPLSPASVVPVLSAAPPTEKSLAPASEAPADAEVADPGQLAVLPAAEPLPDPSEEIPPDSLPLKPLSPERQAAQRKRATTAVRRVDQEGAATATLPERPRAEVVERPCPECAERINARASECYYCGARVSPSEGGKTRRILPSQISRNATQLSGTAMKFSLLGLVLPLYLLSLIGMGAGCMAYFSAGAQQHQESRRAMVAIGVGAAGCVLSTVLVVWLTG